MEEDFATRLDNLISEFKAKPGFDIGEMIADLDSALTGLKEEAGDNAS